MIVHMTAGEYLAYCYPVLEKQPLLRPGDESFTAFWKEAEGGNVLRFLEENVSPAIQRFPFENTDALRIFFAETLGGRLPVIVTGSHADFCSMEAALNGRRKVADYPFTVNAFTIEAWAVKIRRHRVILLGSAPYSNISADLLGLEERDWLERSFRLRLAHECTHYETLRLFGDMRNHALDEIAADAFGQLAAFGNFSAARQRLFFGLEPGGNSCTGRLAFYCDSVVPEERPAVYRAVDAVLADVEREVTALLSRKKQKYDILRQLICLSIAERLRRQDSAQPPLTGVSLGKI